MKKIGFIGLGIMGASMAGHLIDAGYKLSVYNRTKSKADELLARGATWCNTPAECAKDQDVVITMVGYPQDVEAIYFGENGIIDSLHEGEYIIDMTTSSPILAEQLYDAAIKRGAHSLDAPVTGGDAGARDATLTILVGGDEADYEKMKPLFSVIGKNIVYEGKAGAGQKTKACNQIAIAGTLAGVCEAFAYAKASGLEIQNVYDAISKGAASSFQMTGVVRKGLEGDFNPGFMLKHFIKDMHIGDDTGKRYGIDMPVLKQVMREAEMLEADGNGTKGTQVMLKYYDSSF